MKRWCLFLLLMVPVAAFAQQAPVVSLPTSGAPTIGATCTSRTAVVVVRDGLRQGELLCCQDVGGGVYNWVECPLSVSYSETAGALAANGANCDSGQAPLGVDASGAVESCWTPVQVTDGDKGDVVVSGGGASWTVDANAVALGTDTTGSYAAGDAEAGNATGVNCTDCVALGTETSGSYAAGDAEAGNATGVACTDCVGLGTETSGDYVASVSAGTYLDCTGTGEGAAVSCGLDPSEIGNVTWASGSGTPTWIWNVALTDEDPQMTALVDKLDFGGTRLETSDTVTAGGGFLGNASTATALAVNGTDCLSGQAALGVDAAGNAEGCWTPAASGDSISVDGVAVVDPNFDDGGDINFAYSSPNITATVKADSVALNTDTTGQYVSGRTAMRGLIETSAGGDAVTLGFPLCAEGQFLTQHTEPDYYWTCASSALSVENTDLGTLTDGRVCTYDATNTEIDCDSLGGVTDGDKGDVVVSGTGTVWAVDADSVALGTDTTGNYVASLTAGTGIDVGAAAEGGTPTVDFDSTEIGTTTWGTAGATWTFEGGTVDPTFTWASSSLVLGPVVNGTYYCGWDWDADGDTSEDCDDLKACLDAAGTAAAAAEDGTDHAVTVLLPEGNFSCGSTAGMCPYALHGGVSVHGVKPRYSVVPDSGGDGGRTLAPDQSMIPNGGTWLSCGDYTKTMFTADEIRGVELSSFGAEQFGIFLDAGGENAEGIAFGAFRDLTTIGVAGSSPATDIVAFQMWNCQHIYAENIKNFRVDTGWHFRSWNCDWQPANSVCVDCSNFARGRSTTTPLLLFDVQLVSGSPAGCDEANPTSLNFISFVRPQVMGTYGSYAGSSGIKFAGYSSSAIVQGVQMYGLDLEVDAETSVWFDQYANANLIDLSACSPAVTEVSYDDTTTYFNRLNSACDGIDVYTASYYNEITGFINDLSSGSVVPYGNWYMKSGPYRGDAEVISNANYLTLAPVADGVTGATTKRGAYINPYFTSAEESSTPAFYGIDMSGSVTTTDAGAYKSSFYGVRSNPQLSGTAAPETYAQAVSTFTAFHAAPALSWNGDADTQHAITNMTSFRSAPSLGGTYWTASTLRHFYADTSAATSLPTGAGITTYEGLHIADMKALGTQNNAVAIASQTSAANKGNVRFVGGAYDTGHIAWGAFNSADRDHLWMDQTNELLRVKVNGDPSSDTDGAAIVTTGTSANAGTVMWGNSDDTTDTGNEVCALAGLTCVDAKLVDGTDSACDTDNGAAGTYFYALCRTP